MKLFLLLFALAANPIVSYGQHLPRVQPCKVTQETLVPIRGLRLGMPYSGVKGLFKNLTGDKIPDERGSRVQLVADILPQLSDVRKITFIFVDDELEKFEIFYKQGTAFDSIES